MSFEENGYLSKSAEIMASEIYQRNKELFVFSHDLIRYALSIRIKIKPDLLTLQEWVCVGLFLRIVEGVQAVLILVNRGLEYDSWVVIRSIFESFFFLIKSSTDNTFVHNYVKADLKEYRKLVNIATQIPKEDTLDINGYSFNEIKEKFENLKLYLNNEIDSTSILKINREQIAKSVNLSEFYDYGYRQASSYVHISPRSLDRYLEFSENKAYHFFPMPSDYYAKAHLVGLCGLLIKSIKSICQFFQLHCDNGLDIFEKRFFKLNGEYNK